MNALGLFVRAVDRLNETIGRGVAWLTLAMVLITFVVVMLRYVYSIGWVWLHGIVFMVGAGYTLLHNDHVRVDVFYRPASHRFKAWVDLFGSLLLMLPVLGLVFFVSYEYVIDSWTRLEESREAGGLPGLFLLKSVILIYTLVLGLQGLSLAGRSVLVLVGHPEFQPRDEELEGV